MPYLKHFIITFLGLLFIFSSCDSRDDKIIIKAATTTQRAVSFTCSYSENKLKCRKIYSELKINRTSDNEKRFINFIADSLFACWYGTKWNFYGTTEKPGEGTIACGYFVTTLIRDAGIPIQRTRMAQCASEEMIKNTCLPESIKRYSNIDIQAILSDLSKSGFGLYVIGLDNHTGFILNDGKKIYFIHSTYISPGCVIKEEANLSNILIQSKYKVLGKIRI
jgi:hypothetical protein